MLRNTVLYGDCLEKLKEIPDETVQTCVTSPPYFGLRDYGVEGQIGLEETPDVYVAKLIEVFREVRRTLRVDGTFWLNLGDSYSVGPSGRRDHGTKNPWSRLGHKADSIPGGTPIPASKNHLCPPGLKPKDLVGVPWRVALALQADGWWLRSAIIWNKPNVMPESVTDRPTRSYENVFLLAKSHTYFYDADAIREPHGVPVGNPLGRNKRDVWTITTKPYRGAHFAVFPPELPEQCIKAGTSEKGACASCGAPWLRIVERPKAPRVTTTTSQNERDGGLTVENGMERTGMSHFKYNEWLKANPPVTVGWKPSCECGADTRPCLVLDPFAGSGTTLMVAKDLDRDYIGIELNEAYRPLIDQRVNRALDDASARETFRSLTEIDDA